MELDQKTWFKKTWVQNSGLVLIGAVLVYGLVLRDVVSRAKEAYMEAEKYMDWHAHPEKKEAFATAQMEKQKLVLEADLKKNAITPDQYRQKMDLLEFDRKFLVGESSLKYAYQWYKDTHELFSPPESSWVKMARAKAPQALELWKQELREKKIPFEDYMVE
jgi:hypothetical protein